MPAFLAQESADLRSDAAYAAYERVSNLREAQGCDRVEGECSFPPGAYERVVIAEEEVQAASEAYDDAFEAYACRLDFARDAEAGTLPPRSLCIL